MKTTLLKSMMAAVAAVATSATLPALASTQLTASNGDTLSGTYGDHYYTVANNATVTLDGLDITCSDYDHAVIECQGNATLILAPGSVNSVFADHRYGSSSAIHVPSNSTLTIKGSGALTARTFTQDKYAAGIGGWSDLNGNNAHPAGNIVISGGTVTAIGGYAGAGIGAAKYAPCGDITITGDAVVTATSGGGAAGIGGADEPSNVPVSYCGNITISGTATVTATGGKWYSAGIGAGGDSRCGNITIANTVTSVTATRGSYSGVACIGKGCDYLYTSTVGTITIGSCLDQTYSNDNCTLTLTPRYTEIDTVEEFNAIANDLTGLYRLTADLDLQNVQRAPFGEFTGILDGNGHAIRNLNIRRTDWGSGTALFHTLKDGAIVRNLALEGGTVRSNNYQYPMGGIAGYVHGDNVLIEGCTVDLDIVGSDQVGGIVGYAEYAGSLTIRRCRSFASVTSTGNNAGGIIGSLYSMTVLMEDSYSCGVIAANGTVGGLVGYKNGGTLTIDNCYHRSTITGNTNSDRKLVGNGDGNATITGNPTVIDALPKGGVRVCTTGSGTGAAVFENGEIVATPAAGSFFVGTSSEIPSGEFNDMKVFVTFGKEIATIAEFNGITNDLSGIYRLTADLDLDNVARSPFGEFKGLFDGNGHTISNVNISANSDNVGLFSGLKNATVRNLSIRGGRISGGSRVGGLVGYVTGASNLIEDCTTDLEVAASGSNAGGVVGYVGDRDAALTMRRCRSLCAVSYGSSNGGGLVGNKYGDYSRLTVESCYAAGSVQGGSNAGGILGQRMWGTVVISNSYWTTEVRNNYNADTHTVGYGEDSSTIRDTPTILDGFAKNTFSVRTRGNGTGTAAYVNGEFVATPDAGSVFIRWEGLPPEEGDYNETTVWAVFGKPVASLADLRAMELGGYYVQTADIDLAGVTGFTGLGFGGYGNSAFHGYYDGGNHEIRNMTIADGSGLFRTGVEYSEIRNLRIVDACVTYGNYGATGALAGNSSYATLSNVHVVGGSVTATRDRDVGGFVGSITGGMVEDCSCSATVTGGTGQTGGFAGSSSTISSSGPMTIRRCRATGAVTASGSTAGGFVGNAGGTGVISECYASGDVTAGNRNAGGFVGYDNGGAKISDCFALGTVSATNGYAGGFIGYGYMVTCTNCFSVGEATVDSGNVGGFGTQNYLVKFNGSCWDTETSGLGTESGAGEVGRTTAQMKSGVAFEGWDETVWKFSEGLYPRLRAFIPKHTVTWVDDDGTTVLAEGLVEELETPAYDGATPTKAATAQYTYAFAGWTPAVVAIESNTTYTATYEATLRSYTITWLDEDGSVLDAVSVEYGATPTHADPTKADTAQYTYTFAGWSPAVAPVTGAATYQASYTPTLRSYAITWKDDDGSTIGTDTLTYGSTPSHADMSKAATAQYTYTFTGWSPAIATVTGPATYTATYSATVNRYMVTWKDDDGSTLRTDTLDYGATPSYGGTPTKAEDTYNTYTFLGWGPEVVAVTGPATYTAVYMARSKWTGQGTEVEPYTLATPERISEILALDHGAEIYVQTGGEITADAISENLPTGYAVRETETEGVVKVVQILEVVWYDDDGTVLRRDEMDYGETPSYGTPPTKASTAQYDYAFAGWTPEIVAVTESASYTATYTPTLRSYTITWLDADGTSLGTTTVAYGQTPSHAAPASVYTFTGWTPAIVAVTGDATYTATFSHEVLLANLTGDYTAADGDVLTGETAYNVSVPGGATVTVNGVSVTGAGGASEPAAPSFSADAEAVTTKFTQGPDGKWRIVAFAELATGTAAGTEGMITILRGDAPNAVTTPVTPDSLCTTNAVKVEAVVTPPAGKDAQFFRVRFGE